jgi:phytanoyl-CoA hydroxylase
MSDHLQNQFERDGYIVIEQAFSAQSIASIRDAAARIVNEFDIDQHRSVFSTQHRDADRDKYFMDSSEAVHCFLEEEALDAMGNLTQPRDRAINKIGHALHDLVPEFTEFCRQPIIGRLLREIGYIEPHLWQTMYIFKQPRIGGEVRWHQDASYLISEPSSVVGFWVALEDARKDNGCLWVEPGGHHRPLSEIYQVDPQTRQGVLKKLREPNWPQPDEAVAVEVPAGSLVIFSDHMPHYSSPNRSNHSRQAFTMHFAEKTSYWSELNWLQRPTLGVFGGS